MARDLGIPQVQASRFVELARLPEDLFAQSVADLKETGELSMAGMMRHLRQFTRPEKKPARKLPVGKFGVLYADPPWQYEENSTDPTRQTENPYPAMELAAIKALPISEIAHDDAVLFLWAPSPKLEEALEVMRAWGFRYRTCLVWVKDRIGMGYYVRQQHELLLIGIRGQIGTPDPANRPSSVQEAPRSRHRAKPSPFYDLIERMYPELPKVELFSRQSRPGWTAWSPESNE
jgi:N6-adenosine-specific RNA methylase IME4